ncbi:DUF327 family protein [Aminobacterium mobile]|uniref:DUF327 family protein n=1 Tax=Aminobacterium mobile TaxID=81467 RepID=UPI0004671B94|nr:DUF327 family protein [Aminobacterium mobile]
MKVRRSSDRKLDTGIDKSLTGHYKVERRVDEVFPCFDESLEDAEIQELFDRLEKLGEQLSRFPAERLLSTYRTVVKELLRRATGRLRLKKDLRWRRYDKNIFVLMEKTETDLQELSAVLSREGNRMRALRLVEEIKGCLISLFL